MVLNIGRKDRLIRIAVGLGILSLMVIGPKTLWGLIGLIPLITGLVGKCALYSMLGISTAPSGR